MPSASAPCRSSRSSRALIWTTEALRLYRRPGARFPDVDLGLSGAVFVALIGSLLTAIPLSPAGLGIAEAGASAS